jgi:hypothetical protein
VGDRLLRFFALAWRIFCKITLWHTFRQVWSPSPIALSGFYRRCIFFHHRGTAHGVGWCGAAILLACIIYGNFIEKKTQPTAPWFSFLTKPTFITSGFPHKLQIKRHPPLKTVLEDWVKMKVEQYVPYPLKHIVLDADHEGTREVAEGQLDWKRKIISRYPMITPSFTTRCPPRRPVVKRHWSNAGIQYFCENVTQNLIECKLKGIMSSWYTII